MMDPMWLLIGASTLLIVVILIRGWFKLNSERRFFAASTAPTATQIRSIPLPTGGPEYFDWLIQLIRPKVAAGVLQEEPILAALEDRMIHGTPVLREISAVWILLALVLTFYRLHSELPEMFAKGFDSANALGPLINLVGANWGLIGAGMLFHVGSVFQRGINVKRLEVYSTWLERDIFPSLGIARTTSDRLAAALESFSETVKEVKQALYPLSGLATVMAGFQEGLIAQLIPEMMRGLEGVKIGFSDSTLNELRSTAVDTTKALREMKDHQAKMLTLIISSERRTAELALTVQAIADQTVLVTKALQEQANNLAFNNQSLASLQSAVVESTGSSSVLSANVKRLDESTTRHTQQVDSQISVLSTFKVLLPEISSTLVEIKTLMSGVHVGLLGLSVSENNLRTEMEQSREATLASNLSMTASLTNAAALKERWEEAMLQMASLADDISRQMRAFDQSTGDLNTVATLMAARLPQVELALSSVGSHIEKLAGSTAEIATGNKALVTAFGDLQVAGQKLKHLGHSITGHFNVWQEQTKQVFGKAQSSTESIESSFVRIGKVVADMETMLLRLSEAPSKIGSLTTDEREPVAERLSGFDGLVESSSGRIIEPSRVDDGLA